MAEAKKPNILVIWGDDIGITNLSCYSDGLMGYRTPNIDRIANEGMRFTDSYAEQSCTAGRSAFITGQSVFRTGLSKVGLPGADLGLKAEDPTIAELLKPLGYATGQFGKNHLGDKDEYLPSNHGFDEFFGNCEASACCKSMGWNTISLPLSIASTAITLSRSTAFFATRLGRAGCSSFPWSSVLMKTVPRLFSKGPPSRIARSSRSSWVNS